MPSFQTLLRYSDFGTGMVTWCGVLVAELMSLEVTLVVLGLGDWTKMKIVQDARCKLGSECRSCTVTSALGYVGRLPGCGPWRQGNLFYGRSECEQA